MQKLKIFTVAIIALLLNFYCCLAQADTKTIYDQSIPWNDEASKPALLKVVPIWQPDVINNMFAIYQHPEKYLLQPLNNENVFNVQFINAFWGPLTNPFVKFNRPAKALAFVQNNPQQFYLVPIVKNDLDKRSYVFSKDQTQPLELNDWLNLIRKKHPNTTIRFTVCNGYGNLPTDNCLRASYQDEVAYYTRVKTSALPAFPSAYRKAHENWQQRLNALKQFHMQMTGTIYEESLPWSDSEARNKLLANVVTWPNYQVIKSNFEKLRDVRYFDDELKSGFLRRITWLYPDDGCWSRASAVLRDLFGPIANNVNENVRPSKIFVFGDLCANTPNSPYGRIMWWYHTAPIIKDAQTKQTYVLDPAVNPKAPLPLEQWIQAISSQTDNCQDSKANVEKFNICRGYAAGPGDPCEDSTKINFKTESDAMLWLHNYRAKERLRQTELHRDPDQVLGDSPPWLDK